MNLTKLKSGDVVANYPKMCELLEEPEKGGSPKERQIEDWKRYFNYEKKGHKFLILEIYTAPAPKIDGRSQGNNSVYVQYTSSLLLDVLAILALQTRSRESGFVELTNNKIKLILGLCNTEYTGEDEKLFDEMISNKEITTNDKQYFYNRVNSKHNEIIESAFKNLLKNNKCSEITDSYKIAQNGKFRLSTEYEENFIEEVHKLVLDEFGEKDIYTISSKGKKKPFYKRVNVLLEELYNWKVSYKTNLLFFNTDMLIDDSIYKLTEYEQIEFKAIVNNTIKDFTDNQAVDNKSKNELKIEKHNASYGYFKDTVYDKYDKKRFAPRYPLGNPYKDYILHKYYVENQKLLSDLLIKLDD